MSPGSSSGNASSGLNGIGLAENILIEGSLENIFGGKGLPGIDILVQTTQGPGDNGASHTPKMLKFPPSTGFFISLQSAEDGFETNMGLAADVKLHMPNKEVLDLICKLELEFDDKGFGVDIDLDLKGKWKEPFDIPGLELDEVALKFGINDVEEAKFGFRGTAELADGAERIDVAAEMDFELDALGLPDGVAIMGKVSDLSVQALIDIAERMAGGDGEIMTHADLPLPQFKNVMFAFATPGATDPQLQ